MRLAKGRWNPAGRRIRFEEKLAWREDTLRRRLRDEGIPWRDAFREVLVDAGVREEHRADSARYRRAYGSSR